MSLPILKKKKEKDQLKFLVDRWSPVVGKLVIMGTGGEMSGKSTWLNQYVGGMSKSTWWVSEQYAEDLAGDFFSAKKQNDENKES